MSGLNPKFVGSGVHVHLCADLSDARRWALSVPESLATMVGLRDGTEWFRSFELVGSYSPVVEHASFLSYVTTKTPKGLGSSLNVLVAALTYAEDGELGRRVLARVKDLLAAEGVDLDRELGAETLRRVETLREHGGDRRSETAKDQLRNHEVEPGTQTAAYNLARLKRDRPDLAERVIEGELSAHAAAIEAGFRKPPSPFKQLCAAWRRAAPDERDAFKNWLADWRRQTDPDDHGHAP